MDSKVGYLVLFSVHVDVALVDVHFHADYELKVIIPLMVFHFQCVHCVQSSFSNYSFVSSFHF